MFNFKVLFRGANLRVFKDDNNFVRINELMKAFRLTDLRTKIWAKGLVENTQYKVANGGNKYEQGSYVHPDYLPQVFSNMKLDPTPHAAAFEAIKLATNPNAKINNAKVDEGKSIDTKIDENETEPLIMTVQKSEIQLKAEDFVTKFNYKMPSEIDYVSEIGFTEKERELSKLSFVSMFENDDYKLLPDKYCSGTITTESISKISRFYTSIKENPKFNGICVVMSKNEVLANKKFENIAYQVLGKANFDAMPANKLLLFAKRKGIVKLHMRANTETGEIWQDYFYKIELLHQFRTLCNMIIDTHNNHMSLIKIKQQAEATLQEEREQRKAAEIKAETERQERIKLEAQMRLDEIRRRFNPIKNVDEFYTANGFLYLEASKDDFKRSIIGFGLTGEPAERRHNYQSKSTGDAKREFLRIWHVWNMYLIETVIKEMLAPWANPDEKQKPTHRRQSVALSKIEIFDMPFQSISNIVDFVVLKFNEIIGAFKDMAKTMIDVANGHQPEFEPITEIPLNSKSKSKSPSRQHPANPLDKMNDAEFANRLVDLVDAEVFAVSNLHLAQLSDSISVTITWKALRISIRKELSPTVHLRRIRVRVQEAFKDARLKNVKCIFIEKTKT